MACQITTITWVEVEEEHFVVYSWQPQYLGGALRRRWWSGRFHANLILEDYAAFIHGEAVLGWHDRREERMVTIRVVSWMKNKKKFVFRFSWNKFRFIR